MFSRSFLKNTLCYYICNMAVNLDPHSFYLQDPDPHSICGSGSRRENCSNKNRKKARKLLITAVVFNFLSKFAQSSIVSYF